MSDKKEFKKKYNQKLQDLQIELSNSRLGHENGKKIAMSLKVVMQQEKVER